MFSPSFCCIFVILSVAMSASIWVLPSWFILHNSEDISRSLLIFVSSVSAAVTHEHLKDRALFSLPPPPPGANPTEYYHLMTSQRSPYGDLLMQSGAAAAAAAAAAAHLPDYISPVDGEHFFLISIQYQMIKSQSF